MIASLSKFPMKSGEMSVGSRKKGRVKTFKKKSIVRPPDVVKGPPVLSMVKNYAVRVIGEDMDHAICVREIPWNIYWQNVACGLIFSQRRREISIELWIVCKSKTFYAVVINEVPKNVW